MVRQMLDRNPESNNKTRRRFSVKLLLCTLALVVMGLQNQAQAQLKPFKIDGEGLANYIPLPGDSTYHFSVGNGTGLGKYFGEGFEQTLDFTGPATASFSSKVPFVFTGANGDKLACHYGRPDFGAAALGEVTLSPAAGGKFTARFVAEFTPAFEECTGKFSNIIGGSFIMIANTEPFVLGDTTTPVLVSWEGEGAFDWANKSRNWKASATGSFVPGDPGVEVDTFGGYSSQLGKFTGAGEHMLHADFSVTGYATWTAANGDEMYVVYSGFAYLTGDPVFPFGAIAEFEVIGGTGRFVDATGSGTMDAGFTAIGTGDFVFDLEGTLHH